MTHQEQTVPVCLRISADRLEQLKQIARIRAVEERRDVPFTCLIREAIDRAFPKKEGAAQK